MKSTGDEVDTLESGIAGRSEVNVLPKFNQRVAIRVTSSGA